MYSKFLIIIILYFSINNKITCSTFKNSVSKIINYLNETTLTIISSKSIKEKSIFLPTIPKRIITNLSNIENLLESHGNFLFIEDDYGSFTDTLQIFNKSSKWHSTSSFIFLIKDADPTDVFKKLWKVNIYNAVVSTDFKTFYTWYPYSKEGQCGEKFNPTEVTNCNPFYGKIPKKLNKCNFNVAMFSFPVLFDPKTNKGFLAPYLNVMGEKLDLQVNFKFYGDYAADFISTGKRNFMIYQLETYDVEAAFFGSTDGIRLSNYQCEYSKTYLLSNNILIFPKRKEVSSNLFLVFSIEISCLYMVSFIVITVIWKTITKITWMKSFSNMYVLFVLIRLNSKKAIKAKWLFFISIVLWYTYHFSLFYQTNLSSLLTSPKLTPTIKTIQDFLKSDFQIVSTPSLDVSMEPRGEQFLKNIKPKIIYRKSLPEEFKKFLENPVNGVCIPDILLQTVKNVEDLEIMYGDNIGVIHSHIILKKNHPLLYRLNYWIQAIWESGIQERWFYQHSAEIKNTAKNFIKANPIRKLTLTNLKTCFMFLFCGLILSAITLLVEMGVYSKQN